VSDSQEVYGSVMATNSIGEEAQKKKLKFSPPILHKYGQVVKLCKAAPAQGENDFFTS
jgi:hypothetical protein